MLLKPKIRKINQFESKGYGDEPTWKEVESLPYQEYIQKTMRAVNWYYQFYSRKEGQEWLVAWYTNHFPKRKDDVKFISAARTDQISNLLCALYPLEQKGWVARYSVMKHVVKHLAAVIENGRERKGVTISSDETETTESESESSVNVQKRIREHAARISEDLDIAIDSFIESPEEFDSKAFKIVNMLRGSGAKAAHARYIKGFFNRGHAELLELTSGNADDQLKESYKHLPRKNVKKLLEFYDSIMSSCDQIIGEAKILRKPRVKKVKPADDLVKNLKFKITDDDLGIASIPAVQLIGAQLAIVYNSRTRKLGMYIASSSTGLTVKGPIIDNFSDKSVQKTLRKPAEQIKALKDINTSRRFTTWFTQEVATTDTVLAGRMNEDTLILRVFK